MNKHSHTKRYAIYSIAVVMISSFCPANAKLDNRLERLEWLGDAGFGMFIHWSLDSQIGSVISHSMAGASDDYLDWFINELYNNHKWHNPVVVKLTHVQPALKVPPYAETGKAKAQGRGVVVMEGKLLEMAGAQDVTVGFEYQEYFGFAEAMYNTQWTTSPTSKRSATGPFRVTLEGLKPGMEYQYRAVVKHPQLTVGGDHLRIRAE